MVSDISHLIFDDKQACKTSRFKKIALIIASVGLCGSVTYGVMSNIESPTLSSRYPIEHSTPKYASVLDTYREKSARTIQPGLYRAVINSGYPASTQGLGGEAVVTLYLNGDHAVKEMRFTDSQKTLHATAEYSYIGSTIIYHEIKGDAALFHNDGNAILKTNANGFSLLKECWPSKALYSCEYDGLASERYQPL